jgi:uncharacterized coiled-coil protein SlyX
MQVNDFLNNINKLIKAMNDVDFDLPHTVAKNYTAVENLNARLRSVEKQLRRAPCTQTAPAAKGETNYITGLPSDPVAAYNLGRRDGRADQAAAQLAAAQAHDGAPKPPHYRFKTALRLLELYYKEAEKKNPNIRSSWALGQFKEWLQERKTNLKGW